MKRVRKYWVDGDYRTERECRKRHPEGFDTTFTREFDVATIGDYVLPAGKWVALIIAVAAVAVVMLQMK